MSGGEMSPVSRRKLLSSLGADHIFEFIKDAIAVAALDHPHELVQSRILQMRHAATASSTPAVDETAPVDEKVDDGTKKQSVGDEKGSAGSDEALSVNEQVARINSQLLGDEDGRPSSDEAVLQSLRALQTVPMNFETLEATKIGRSVSGLRKHASEQVRELAGNLYKGWKSLADEHFRSTRASPESTNTAAVAVAANAKAKAAAPKPTPTSKSKSSGSNQEAPLARREAPKVVVRVRGSSAPITTAASTIKAKEAARKTEPPAPKPSYSGACKRKAAPTSIDEARLATAKRRLQEGYQEAATIRKQRMVQLIAAPGKAQQRPALVERRCVVRYSAVGAGKRAPVPSSLSM